MRDQSIFLTGATGAVESLQAAAMTIATTPIALREL